MLAGRYGWRGPFYALGVHDAQRVGVLTMIASLGVPIGTFAYWTASRLRISWLLCLDFALIGVGFFGMVRAVDPGGYVMSAFINQLGCGLVLPTSRSDSSTQAALFFP